MEFAEIIEKFGFGVGAAIGLAFVVRWILTRVAGVMDAIHEKMVKHEKRSSVEHTEMIGAIRKLTDRPCLHRAEQGGGE